MSDISDIEQELFGFQQRLSPTQFQELAQEWAFAVALQIGRDPATFDGAANDPYLLRLQPYIDAVNQHNGLAEAKVILEELSQAVQSQSAAAAYLHHAAAGNGRDSRAPLFAGDMPERRWIADPLGLIEFLKEPLTQDTSEKFSAARGGLFPPGMAEKFYRDYMALPFTEQARFLRLVFEETRHGGYKKVLNAIKDHSIINEFLPKDGGHASAYRVGKTIAGAFAWMAPPDIAAEAIASVIAAIRDDLLDQQSLEPRAHGAEERFSYRLGGFMDKIPGASKVAQYAHSLAKDEWMPGLAGSKTEAERGSRYEVLQWIKAAVPDGVRIDRVTEYKGTGAYAATYGVELDPEYRWANPLYATIAPEEDLVISVLKPKVQEKSLRFVNFLLHLGEYAARFNQEAFKSVAPLLEIVRQGKKAIAQETDMRNSVPQEKMSGDYFNGLVLDAAKRRIRFYTQGAFDCGKEFRIARKVKGEHFNKLPHATRSERRIKRKVAAGMFIAAGNMIFRGKPFNHDLHGDNEGVRYANNEISIGVFDSGAVDLDVPAADRALAATQKRMLADCLFNALANSARNLFEPVSSFKHTVAKTAENIGPDRQQELDYAKAVLRAFLSINDYRRHMRIWNILLAIATIRKSGKYDREFSAHLRRRRKACVSLVFAQIRTAVTRRQLPEKHKTEIAQRQLYYPHNPRWRVKKQQRQQQSAL